MQIKNTILRRCRGWGPRASTLLSLALILVLLALGGVARAQLQAPASFAPPPLNTIPVPEPANLGDYVQDKAAAIQLGKALFWDMQVGSDGIQACASCHFHAGADNRAKGQLNPGILAGDTAFSPPFGNNYELTESDFPLHRRADPEDQGSTIIQDTNDVVSSMGVHFNTFDSIVLGNPVDAGTPADDPLGVFSGFRRVEPRNAPTVINAVFNFDNFPNGRARNMFNGQNPFGFLDLNAGIFVDDRRQMRFVKWTEQNPFGLRPLENASLASQAVEPPLSDIETSWRGRTWAQIGKKMLSLRPLALQMVHPQDSVLGGLSRARLRRGVLSGDPGLRATYAQLIQRAFYPQFWNSRQVVVFGDQPATTNPDIQNPRQTVLDSGGTITIQNAPRGVLPLDQFTQMEANFAFFYGVAVQLYEATLVSDDTPFDRFQAGDAAALTPDQFAGMEIFFGEGLCNQCHSGPEFTGAAVNNLLALGEGPIELMGMAAGGLAFYDVGFYNISVRPTDEDLGRGGTAPQTTDGRFENPFNNNELYPLSFSRLALLKVDGKLPPEMAPFVPDPPGITNITRTAVDGAIKTPTLRNVELTGPYFRNGDSATLLQAVDFYIRGGNFPAANIDNLDPFITTLGGLQGNETGQEQLVAFMLALTDERVKFERAPFDHPQLWVPVDGTAPSLETADLADPDMFMEVPAVGAGGRATPLEPFLGIPQLP